MNDDEPRPSAMPYSTTLLYALVAVQRLCTYTEHRVLGVYAARANADRTSYPTIEQIATDTGLAPFHVSAAIKTLSQPQPPKGAKPGRQALIEVVGAGGGKGRATLRRVLIEGDRTLTESVKVSTTPNTHGFREGKLSGFCANPHGFRAQTLTDSGANLHGFGAHTLTESVRPRGQEENKEVNEDKARAADASVRVEVGELFGDDKDPAESKPTRPTAKSKTPSPAIVDAIYLAYPRKKVPVVAKAAIAKALKRLAGRTPNELDGRSADEWLLARVTQFAAARIRCHNAGVSEKQHTPYPASWFNGGSYDEDPAEWEPAAYGDLNGTKKIYSGVHQRPRLQGAGQGFDPKIVN